MENDNNGYVHCKDCYYYFNNFLCLKFSKLGSMAGVKGLTVENRIVAIVGSEFGCAEGMSNDIIPLESMDDMAKKSRWNLFHILWTKAVGQVGYDKREWIELEKRLK